MKIYVGYILGDYAHACCMGTEKIYVQRTLDSYPTRSLKWIEEYDLSNPKEVIELNNE